MYTFRVHKDNNYTATMEILTFRFFYNGNSLAKILQFYTVVRKLSITMEKDLDPDINVHPDNGNIIMFKQCSRGIYYYFTTNM